jgi:hypothetical protein
MAATNKRTKTILQVLEGQKPAERRLLSPIKGGVRQRRASPVINFSISGFVNYGFTDASSLPFDLRDVILLDKSTVDLFCNPDLVSISGKQTSP